MGPIAKWLLRRVVASALALERDSLQRYRRLRERAGPAVHAPLVHLLEEEERHRGILEAAAAGRLDAAGLELLVRQHLYRGIEEMEPLDAATLREWGPELEGALAEEERTCVFYSNLRRISRIPVVRRAFEVIVEMEREHVEILRRLLGRRTEPAPEEPVSRPARRRCPRAPRR